MEFPQGQAQLTGLRTLRRFNGGSRRNKMGLLKNLNHLSGSLWLDIRIVDDGDLEGMVEDARKAELRNKIHIQQLKIVLCKQIREKESSLTMDVLDALEPHPNLQSLIIQHFRGSKFPGWITSPLNRLKKFRFDLSVDVPSVPPLGKLPCLEEVHFSEIEGLHFLGWDFLGITTTAFQSSSSSVATAATNNNTIGFPNLKMLTFEPCHYWKEWEDITVEEGEESAGVTLMPCLRKLAIKGCIELAALPLRLLRTASSLEVLAIGGSRQLIQRYGDKDGSAHKSISQQNPHLRILYF